MKKIVIIGFGSISKTYFDIIPEVKDATLVAIIEPNASQTKSINSPDLKIYSNLKEMLAQDFKPDVAIICTPPDQHFPIVIDLLHAGIDCLIEKPMGLTFSETQQITATAKKLKRKIATSAKFKAIPAIIHMKESILRGDLGELRQVECTFSSLFDAKSNWRSNPQISGGGVWMDNGPHAIDVVETLAGPIKKIKMNKFLKIHQSLVEDEVEVDTLHHLNVKGTIKLSWNRVIQEPFARCLGTKSQLIADWADYNKKTTFKNILQEFLESQKSDTHGETAINWIQAAYRSSISGQWEEIA